MTNLSRLATRLDVPTYAFDFGDGICSPCGEVIRSVIGHADAVDQKFAYRFDDRGVAAQACKRLPPILADLMDLANAVYVVDRLSPRSARGLVNGFGGPAWDRNLIVKLAVRVPDLWCSEETSAALDAYLRFISDDDWQFHFDARTERPRASEIQPELGLKADPDLESPTVALFSGGVDSLLGLVRSLNARQATSIVAVSAVTNPRLGDVQANLKRELGITLQKPIQRSSIAVSLLGAERKGRVQEGSQRGRSFLFLATAAVTAVLNGSNTVLAFENGIGAINLPYLPNQFGAQSARGVHPLALRLLGQLVSSVLGRLMNFENPGLWFTKGALCSDLLQGPLVPIIGSTVTCDWFPYLKDGYACGTCTSCLLRRISLLAAGLAESTTYELDVLACHKDLSQAQMAPLFAMGYQSARLREALRTRTLLAEFPDLNQVLIGVADDVTQIEARRRLTDLYSDYLKEWDLFSSCIGLEWWECESPSANHASVPDAAMDSLGAIG